jgi:hypothetical protein
MKHVIVAVAAVFAVAISTGNVFGAETKKVCIEQKQKDGKMKNVCKDVKVHKKLDGTAVPAQKK